jgi:hypothetical protein
VRIDHIRRVAIAVADRAPLHRHRAQGAAECTVEGLLRGALDRLDDLAPEGPSPLLHLLVGRQPLEVRPRHRVREEDRVSARKAGELDELLPLALPCPALVDEKQRRHAHGLAAPQEPGHVVRCLASFRIRAPHCGPVPREHREDPERVFGADSARGKPFQEHEPGHALRVLLGEVDEDMLPHVGNDRPLDAESIQQGDDVAAENVPPDDRRGIALRRPGAPLTEGEHAVPIREARRELHEGVGGAVPGGDEEHGDALAPEIEVVQPHALRVEVAAADRAMALGLCIPGRLERAGDDQPASVRLSGPRVREGGWYGVGHGSETRRVRSGNRDPPLVFLGPTFPAGRLPSLPGGAATGVV